MANMVYGMQIKEALLVKPRIRWSSERQLWKCGTYVTHFGKTPKEAYNAWRRDLYGE